MMICNECGNQLNDTAKFCKSCGTKVEKENITIVEGDASAVVNNQAEELSSGVSTDEATTEASANVVDKIEAYTFDYIDFLKETLMHPTSAFRGEKNQWIVGAISLVLYAIVFALNIYGNFFTAFFTTVVFQAVFVGLLFLLNKFLLGGNDTYLDALGKYGGLVNMQIILFLLVKLLGIDSGFGIFLFWVAIMNQLNIFNLYVLNSQSNVNHKLDRYYQLLVSYIPFMIMLYFMIGEVL